MTLTILVGQTIVFRRLSTLDYSKVGQALPPGTSL